MSNTFSASASTPLTNNPVEVIQSILATLNIKRIVFVDDIFTSGLKRILEFIAVGIDGPQKQQILELFEGVDFEEVRQSWEDEIRQHWQTKQRPEQRTLFNQVYGLNIGSDNDDVSSAKALKMLLAGSGIEYYEIPPEKWLDSRDKWISEATINNKLVCLFDKDFNSEYNEEQYDYNGIDLLQHVIREVDATNSAYDGRVLFGIFSHTLKITNELEVGRKMCVQHSIPSNLFLPISKSRRNEVRSLAEGIQMVVLSLYAGVMKRIVKEVMEIANNEASSSLDELSVFDFDDIVLQSSLKEGVWEGETLVRIFLVILQQRGWTNLASVDTASFFNQQVAIARQIALPRLVETHSSTEASALRRMELYQNGDALNSFHTPLRLGDIFEVNASYQYILLAPPCDLMVRSGKAKELGKRGQENEIQYVELFRIRSTTDDAIAKLKAGELKVMGFLKHYKAGKPGRVTFKERILVPIKVLDLAVLNSNGACRIDIKNIPAIPGQFHPAWIARHSILVEYFKGLSTPLNGINELLKKKSTTPKQAEALKPMKSAYLNPNKALPEEPTYDDGVFDFKFKRHSHYKFSASQHLLTEYAHFLSRAAEDHDFSSQPHVPTPAAVAPQPAASVPAASPIAVSNTQSNASA